MINLYSKEELIHSLVEARKKSYDEFIDEIEFAKSIHGHKFTDKVWEYLGINLEYANTSEGISMIDEKIYSMIDKPLNEKKSE